MSSPQSKIRFSILITLFIVLGLAACDNGAASTLTAASIGSDAPSETQPPAVPSTATVEAPLPTVEYSSEIIVVPQPTPDAVPQVTASLPGNKIPQSLIQIVSPGPGSRLSQAFTMRASVYPGENGSVTIRLFGEDGRVITEFQDTVQTPDSGWVSIAEKINFSTNAAGEAAILAVSTHDGYGRRLSLSSVKLILLQIGPNEVEVSGFRGDPFVVKFPAVGGMVRGGVLHVEGAAHPFSSQPLIVELIDTEGRVLASSQLILPELPAGADYVPFALDVPYQVSSRTPVRLTLRQVDSHPAGVDLALSSLPVFLDP